MSNPEDFSNEKFYKISEVERLTGVNASTLRLWERHNLITPIRRGNNYRLYTNAHLSRVRDIVRLRNLENLPLTIIRDALIKQAEAIGENTDDFNLHALQADSNVSAKVNGFSPSQNMGLKLRARRKDLGLSIRQVADETGLSPSHISVFETTSTGASIDTLIKLAEHYNTNIHELNRLEGKAKDIQILRGAGRLLPTNVAGLHIEQMGEGFLEMDATKVTLDVRCDSGNEPYSHKGEEFIFVLSGTFEITFDGSQVQTLNKGDSVCFSSSHLHSWRNPGSERTELLWINSIPQFEV